MKSVRSVLKHHCSRSRLSCYLDGQLSSRTAARVDEHLEECPSCRNDLESLRATIALLRNAPAPCMPRSVTIPESAIAAQCQTRRVDTVFAAVRLGAVAVTLMLAVLLSQEVIRVARPVQVQTFAVEMASDSVTAREGAGDGPGVLREPPLARKTVPDAEPVAALEAAQAEEVVAAKEAEFATGIVSENEAAPEALSLMAAPVAEGTASPEGPQPEMASAVGEVAEEVAVAALEQPLEAQAEMAGSDSPMGPRDTQAQAELLGSGEPEAAKLAAEEPSALWTPYRVAAVILATLLVILLGTLLWVGRRRVTL